MKDSKISSILLYVSIFLLELSNYAQNIIIINPIKNILFYVALFISFINIIFVIKDLKLSIKKIFMLILLLIASIIISYATNNEIFIELLLLFISSLNTSFDTIIKKDLKMKIFIFCFIFISSFFGLAIKTGFYRDELVRYAFGFTNPNTAAIFFLISYFEYIYINKNCLNIGKLIVSSLLFLVLIYLTDSRSSIIAVFVFLFLYLLNNKKNIVSDKKIIKFIVVNLFILFTILSYKVTIDFSNNLDYAIKLNKTLSARIWMQNYYYLRYSISLIGNNIDFAYTIDNVYIRTLFNFGIIGVIFMNHIYKKMIDFSIKNKDNLIFCIIITLLIYGTMEWYIIRPVLNIFLFYYSTNVIKKVGGINE